MTDSLAAALAVFLLMFATDWLWARYVRFAQDGLRHAASAMSSGLVLTSALTTLAYVEHHWLVIPALAGAYAGTFAGLGAKRSA